MLNENLNHDSASPSNTQTLLPTPSTFYVIDDELQMRRSLHFLLSNSGYQCWTFASASDFLENLPNLTPSPILLDVRMEKVSGIDLLSILADHGIKWPVIIMTAHGDIATAVQALKLGAIEFLEKPFELEMLQSVLQSASANLLQIQKLEHAKQNSKRLFDKLTAREYEVISQLAAGSANKEVAFHLSLSPRTVEMHRSNALSKLHVRSIAEVLRLATDGDIKFAPQL